MRKQKSTQKGFYALIGTAFILGTFGIWIRELDKMFGNSTQVLVRSVIGAVIISLIIFFKKTDFKIEKKYYKYLLGFSVVFPLSIIAFTISATTTKVSTSLFMLYIGSLLCTYIVGTFIFKEAFTFLKGVSVALLLTGLTIYVWPLSVKTLTVGILFGFLAGILEGGSHSFRKLLGEIPREIVVFFQTVSSIVVAVIILYFSREVMIKTVIPSAVYASFIFGALQVVMGYLLVYGFSHFDVNIGAIILATELVFALIINYLFLNEVPTLMELTGGTLIFLGTVVTSIQFSPKKPVKKLSLT
jgi:drug/metabolite transporter (DMT)-like permease